MELEEPEKVEVLQPAEHSEQFLFPVISEVQEAIVSRTGVHRRAYGHNRTESSGGWKSEIKVPSGLVSGETSPPGLKMAVFSLHPHLPASLCVPLGPPHCPSPPLLP